MRRPHLAVADALEMQLDHLERVRLRAQIVDRGFSHTRH
jgi:hypothetical protein